MPIEAPAFPGDRWRAAYATHPMASRGRLLPEAPDPTRSVFQRDRDRVIHSTAFRRMKHKTQVFVSHEGDHYRTRLTHSLEVSQIARSLARALGLDEDLAECLALAHDLGHTPFGHAGERALDRAMTAHGGFDHNAQALRVVTRLERRYAAFDGLNLSWETLEGLVKHNGPLRSAEGSTAPGVSDAIIDFDAQYPLDLHTQAGPEAQAAAIADDIAYNAHDLDDGLRAGLFTPGDLHDVPLLRPLIDDLCARHHDLQPSRFAHEIQRRVITLLIEDAIAESRRRLATLAPEDVSAIRMAPLPVVGFSSATAAAERTLKAFLRTRMYQHPAILRINDKAEEVIGALVRRLLDDPTLLPENWRADPSFVDPMRRPRHVADFIAGMTDNYALELHRRLFDHTPALR